jgi:hypothetical protein
MKKGRKVKTNEDKIVPQFFELHKISSALNIYKSILIFQP